MTLAGTWIKAVLLLVRLTKVPPAGAGVARVTMPVEVAPFTM